MLRLQAQFRQPSRAPRSPRLALCALATLCVCLPAHTQAPNLLAPAPQSKKKDHGKAKTQTPPGPRPAAEIPLQQLGFSPPSLFHLGDRWVQGSLSFLDENRLLFTFRVPGLVVRDPVTGDAETLKSATEGRNIRALVLSLPSGRVEAEALWRLHDYAAYLWPLANGGFLLRDRNLLQLGDASLHLEPFLRFPGPLKYLELDPTDSFLVTQNAEPHAAPDQQSDQESNQVTGTIASNHGIQGDPQPSVLPNPGHEPGKSDLATYLRIFRMSDRKILTTTPLNKGLLHVAVDGHGYYDVLRRGATTWQVVYHGFDGADTILTQLESQCSPPLDVVAPGFVLISACDDSGGRQFTVMTRDKRRLWSAQSTNSHVWPLVESSANGRRIARATLDVTHAVTGGIPLEDPSEIRSQTVQVFDTATGKVAITGPTRPILDGGGNFALSPTGNRFAVLNNDAIQVYDLAPAPELPPINPSAP